MATLPQFVPVDTLQDLEYPQREAAFFYGLFLRGHSADQLRRDIEVPSAVLAKWHREAERDPQLKDVFERMVDYRRHVLAIFDALVGSDGQPLRHPGCAHSVRVRRGCGGRDAFPALRFRSKTVKQPNFIPRALTPCGVKCQKMQGIAGD